MKTKSFRLSDEMIAKLSAEARLRGISESRIVRELFDKGLSGLRKTKNTKKKNLYERAKHLIGSIKEGPEDLLTNPKYMEDYGA